MNKFFLFLCVGFLFILNAQQANKNLEDAIKSTTGFNVKVVNMTKLKSLSDVYVAILQDEQKQAFPLFTTKDGKSFWALTQFYKFSNEEDNNLIISKIAEIEKINNAPKNEAIEEMLNSFSKEDFVMLSSKTKTDKLLTIVTDPDCPYCKEELKRLKSHLDTSNVRLVFAVVHDKKAFVKAQLILNETKNIDAKDTDKIIAVVEKYYKNINLTDKQMKTDIKNVEKTTNSLFSSGLIRGVPYIHEGTLK